MQNSAQGKLGKASESYKVISSPLLTSQMKKDVGKQRKATELIIIRLGGINVDMYNTLVNTGTGFSEVLYCTWPNISFFSSSPSWSSSLLLC